MEILYPSGDVGFVEYKRAFCVQGAFSSNADFEGAELEILLTDKNGSCIRRLYRRGTYGGIKVYDSRLTAYPESRDPGREKLKKFGFPELATEKADDFDKCTDSETNGTPTKYDESEKGDACQKYESEKGDACQKYDGAEKAGDSEQSLRRASGRLWFSEKEFKGVFVCATDTAHGAPADDGMNYTDDENKPYGLIPLGDYTIKATLFCRGAAKESAEKKITVGRRENQLICRFNPREHKERIVRWCSEMGFSAITDPLPGYLESYLGDWDYHKGLLKMYRANDIPLFESAKVRMFVYLADPESTSLETELAYLQSVGAVGDPERFFAYHYDIGEAVVGAGRDYERQGTPTEFAPGEYLSLCRADIVGTSARDGIYYMDERDVVRCEFFSKDAEITVEYGEKFAIHGVMKPWQGAAEDFVLRDDNTYEVNNYPYIMQYTVVGKSTRQTILKKADLERFDEKSIGHSVYEFYNIFDSKMWKKGETLSFSVVCTDRKGNKAPPCADFFVKVI